MASFGLGRPLLIRAETGVLACTSPCTSPRTSACRESMHIYMRKNARKRFRVADGRLRPYPTSAERGPQTASWRGLRAQEFGDGGDGGDHTVRMDRRQGLLGWPERGFALLPADRQEGLRRGVPWADKPELGKYERERAANMPRIAPYRPRSALVELQAGAPQNLFQGHIGMGWVGRLESKLRGE